MSRRDAPAVDVRVGDCLVELKSLPDRSVHCVVTSPPYFGQRDYGHAGQIGLEESPAQYVARLVAVFREVWRVLCDDGVAWLNLGDSYATRANGPAGVGAGRPESIAPHAQQRLTHARRSKGVPEGLKHKDLMGIPWRLALALRSPWLACEGCGAEHHASQWGRMPAGAGICPGCHEVGRDKVTMPGWVLRQDVIWHKKNPLPEAVRDRCVKAHEYLFLLTKSPQYYYDNEAIKEIASGREPGNRRHKYAAQYQKEKAQTQQHRTKSGLMSVGGRDRRNRRSVWYLPVSGYRAAHFATFPPELVAPCVLAGTSERGHCPECGARWERERGRPEHWQAGCDCGQAPVPDVVLDPFGGSGTTAGVSQGFPRHWDGHP